MCATRVALGVHGGHDQPCFHDPARRISANEIWEAMMFKRIDHVEIVTDQLDCSSSLFIESI